MISTGSVCIHFVTLGFLLSFKRVISIRAAGDQWIHAYPIIALEGSYCQGFESVLVEFVLSTARFGCAGLEGSSVVARIGILRFQDAGCGFLSIGDTLVAALSSSGDCRQDPVSCYQSRKAMAPENTIKRRDQTAMDEELKQPLLISVLVANGVIVASQLIFKLKYPGALLGILLGVAIGGAVFAAMYFRNRD
ncbi:MAG: hypothetical protein CMJ81_19740 [Planctomycetaceae bacterium]|nr:hypothetical protein [Planctomycetaceae bacterium]MBP63166.1 hypothetical protein [Planctomycetaceae bacterium]